MEIGLPWPELRAIPDLSVIETPGVISHLLLFASDVWCLCQSCLTCWEWECLWLWRQYASWGVYWWVRCHLVSLSLVVAHKVYKSLHSKCAKCMKWSVRKFRQTVLRLHFLTTYVSLSWGPAGRTSVCGDQSQERILNVWWTGTSSWSRLSSP